MCQQNIVKKIKNEEIIIDIWIQSLNIILLQVFRWALQWSGIYCYLFYYYIVFVDETIYGFGEKDASISSVVCSCRGPTAE